jgi:glycosyltransferase involved in cell wall biosynthesis
MFWSYGPYHLARLRAARKAHSVLALEFSSRDGDYVWNTEQEKRAAGVTALTGSGNGRGSTRASLVDRLCRELRMFSPDAVAVPGYSEPFSLAVLRKCRTLGIPVILMSDTHAGSIRKIAVRELVKRKLLSLYQAALVAGSPQAEYLRELGFPEQSIALGYDVIDNKHFARSCTGTALPLAWDNTRRPYFFCCSRLVEKKNLPVLIDAFVRYRGEVGFHAWDLVIAGDGPSRPALERRITASPVARNIHLIGHKTYEELPRLYQHAGAFILSSAVDEWGLVVNEAMAAGLPVLVSENAGCSRDLVIDGVNGFTFDPANSRGLAALMRRVAASSQLSEMGLASRRIIAGWDLDRFASGLTHAAEIARQARRHPGSQWGAALATVLSHRI